MRGSGHEIRDSGYEMRARDPDRGPYPVSRIATPASWVGSFIVNPIKRLLNEPLFHFLLIGALLFAVDHYVNPMGMAAPSSKQIQLSVDELAQLVLLFQAQWRREPTT